MKGSGVKAFISGNEKDLPVLQNQLGGGVCLAHKKRKDFSRRAISGFGIIQNKGAVVIWQTDTVGFKEEMRGNSCKTDKIFQRNMMFGIAIRYHADRGLWENLRNFCGSRIKNRGFRLAENRGDAARGEFFGSEDKISLKRCGEIPSAQSVRDNGEALFPQNTVTKGKDLCSSRLAIGKDIFAVLWKKAWKKDCCFFRRKLLLREELFWR